MALFAAGLLPLLAPYTSFAAWYRFLIALAPLLVPLAIVHFARMGGKRPLAAYALLIIFIGTYFILPNGNFMVGKLTVAYTEFPPGLAPDPANRALLEDLAKLKGEIRTLGLDENKPIISGWWEMRWLHLALRNPQPGSLIYSSLTGYDIYMAMRNLNASSCYIFTYSLPQKRRQEPHRLRRVDHSWPAPGSRSHFHSGTYLILLPPSTSSSPS